MVLKPAYIFVVKRASHSHMV